MKSTKARIIAALLASAIGLSSFSMSAFAGEEALPAKNTDSSSAVGSDVVDQPYTWGNFRADENNNGAVDKRTPKSADDTVLYWAARKGSGFSSNFGSPIIVDGDIIATAGTNIYRLNRFTGEQIGEPGVLAGGSNFNIIPPVYSDGMIFVGLSNGRVQAFDAETLKSLWVYQDELKGQPNSPLVVHDGCLYTGFWNSETKDANFVCLDIKDEDPESTDEAKQNIWTHTQTGGFYLAGAYVCDSFVLVGTDDGKSGSANQTSTLLSLNPKTGDVIDKIENLNGDIRSGVCFDKATDRCYFTSRGGSFYSASVNADGTFKTDSTTASGYDIKELALGGTSTSTPVVHNGRAYIGVSGKSQMQKYGGHSITVIDLKTFTVAYKAGTMGFPQAGGLLSTAYEDSDGYAYVYFTENYAPGIVRVIKDKPGVTSVIDPATESANGKTYTDCAPVLFTPSGKQAQYAIASPICDEYGTLYFKNDSGYMMAVGSKPQEIKIETEPSKTVYTEDAPFNKSGLKVTAYFANGLSRDVTDEVKFSKNAEKLSLDDTEVTVYYNTIMYGDQTNPDESHSSNVQYEPLEAYIDVTVLTSSQAESVSKIEALIDSIGKVTLESEQAVSAAENAYNTLSDELREYVSNSNTLMLARTELDTIKNVYTLIASIGDVDYSKANAIDSALKAYDSLSEEQKAEITNSADLTSALQTLDALKAEINSVKNLINAIGNVTLESESAVTAARTAYDNLPEASKSGVDNIDVLVGAEAALSQLKNQTTEPTKPTKPSDNSGVAEPSKPSDNSGTTEPTKPTDNSGETEPSEPSNNSGETEPTKPSDNSSEAEPTEPTDNSNTTEPTEPSDNSGTGNTTSATVKTGDSLTATGIAAAAALLSAVTAVLLTTALKKKKEEQ